MSFILKCILLNETLETWGKAARVALRSLPLYCGKRVFCAHSHSSVCCIASIHYISASIGTWSHIALFEVDLPMRQSQKFSRKNMSRVELEWTPVRNKLLENMWEKMNKEHLWYTVNDRFLTEFFNVPGDCKWVLQKPAELIWHAEHAWWFKHIKGIEATYSLLTTTVLSLGSTNTEAW